MALADSRVNVQPAKAEQVSVKSFQGMLESLRACFGVRFSVLDISRDEFLERGDLEPAGHIPAFAELGDQVLRREHAEFIADEDPIAVLAVPIGEDANAIAVAPFMVRSADESDAIRALNRLGFSIGNGNSWVVNQIVWPANRLLQVANLVVANYAMEFRRGHLQHEVEELSAHLAATYEELSLLYGLTQKLRISASIEELGAKALEWLAEAITAQGFLLKLAPPQSSTADSTSHLGPEFEFLTFGRCPINRHQISDFLNRLELDGQPRSVVINPASRSEEFADWNFRDVRQAVVVPLMEGENLFGWLAAFNHDEDREFGSSEASLLSSVAAILGIHAGNIELYRQQAEFLAGVVRALTSAIDAKDPYTCGHSDRVARIAVKLADKLGCDGKELETIYLSGLLHDIGKIGIDDHVLRKPGRLTEAEYEHIKMHADIGYRILKDLKQLGQVLPAVRHHHEAWDGSGYPFGLAGEEIPLYARIVAVADAFDAMSSDRPYRKGMLDEKLDSVFKSGAGKQWDAEVITAFFAAREEIRRIAHTDIDAPATELAHLT